MSAIFHDFCPPPPKTCLSLKWMVPKITSKICPKESPKKFPRNFSKSQQRLLQIELKIDKVTNFSQGPWTLALSSQRVNHKDQ